MPKVSPETLAEVRNAFKRYEREVNASRLGIRTKSTYIHRAELFVRWLEDDFTPGSHG